MRKPKGWEQFDALARRLATVPKDAVDAEMKAKKRRRRKKK